MADGGIGEMGGLAKGAEAMGGGGGKGGGGGGSGAAADSSGLGASGAGMADGGMGAMGGGSESMAGSPASGLAANQSTPSLQAAMQGDPTGSASATQAMSGGAPSPPGSAGGVGGVQSSPQPSAEGTGGNIGPATVTPTTSVSPASMPTAQIPGSQPTAPPGGLPTGLGAQPSVSGPTGFTPNDGASSFNDRFGASDPAASFNDRFGAADSSPASFNDRFGAGDTEPNMSNAEAKSDRDLTVPQQFAHDFRPYGLSQLAQQMQSQQFPVDATDPSMPRGNINTLGDFDPFTSAVAGGEAPQPGTPVPTSPATVGDQSIPGSAARGPGEPATSQPEPATSSTAPPTQEATTDQPGAGDGTKPPTDGTGAKPDTRTPDTSPPAGSSPGGGGRGADGGAGAGAGRGAGGGPGGGLPFDPLKIIQAFLQGGPMGGLAALAQQIMGGSPMGGPNNAPWAPGYGPNNSFRNPQTDAAFGPRDRFGRPIGSGVPTKTSAAPPPVTTNPPNTPKLTTPTPPTAGAVPPDEAPRPQAPAGGVQPGLGAAAKPLTAGNGPNQVAYVSRRFPLQNIKPTQATVARSWANGEVDRNPMVDGVPLDQKMFQMVTGEVGRNASPEAKIVQLETAFNRAQMRGHSISQAFWGTQRGHVNAAGNDMGYYPPSTMNARNMPYNQQELDDFKQNVLAPVLNGANLSDIGYGPMTGNASSDLAARQLGRMPGYKMNGGDTYFREGPLKDLPPIEGPQSSADQQTKIAFAAPRPAPQEPDGLDWGEGWRSSPEDLPPWQDDQQLPRGVPKPNSPTDPYSIPTDPQQPIKPRGNQVGWWAGPDEGFYG